MPKTKEQQLMELCQRFIKFQQISCAESVYQVDSVSEESLPFIEQICEIVGYHEDEE